MVKLSEKKFSKKQTQTRSKKWAVTALLIAGFMLVTPQNILAEKKSPEATHRADVGPDLIGLVLQFPYVVGKLAFGVGGTLASIGTAVITLDLEQAQKVWDASWDSPWGLPDVLRGKDSDPWGLSYVLSDYEITPSSESPKQ